MAPIVAMNLQVNMGLAIGNSSHAYSKAYVQQKSSLHTIPMHLSGRPKIGCTEARELQLGFVNV